MRLSLRTSGRTASVIAALSLLASPAVAEGSAQAYRLGPGDVLQIGVPGQPELSGRFRVGPDGMISAPLIGQLTAGGRLVAEMTADLSSRYAERVPIRVTPSLEIVEYAPVFAAGEVEKPGQYAFRPGMVALELMSVAGGARKPAGPIEMRTLQIIAAEQDVGDRRAAIYSDRVKRRRIEAELSRADFSAADEDRTGDGAVSAEEAAGIMARETALFEARRRLFRTQEQALRDQSENFDKEIASLRKGLELHGEEIKLLEQEVGNSQKLFDKGLGMLPTLLGLKRQLSATRRDALDLDAYLARAQQRRLEIDQKLAELAATQARENADALRELNLMLGQNTRRLAAALATVAEIRADLGRTALTPRAHSYRIARITDGVYREIEADDYTRIEPRDILRVDRAFTATRLSEAPRAGEAVGTAASADTSP